MQNSLWIKTITQEKPLMQPWTVPQTQFEWRLSPQTLDSLTEEFDPIGLRDMDSVTLLNRVDVKFVLTEPQLINTLRTIREDYRILTVSGHRLNHYRTLYFDTSDFHLFNLHVNERADRYKVRTREYSDSSESFFEVKHRTRKDRTIKDRIPTEMPVLQMNNEVENWLQHYVPEYCSDLEPKLWNTFTRITLVSKSSCERVTIDTDLIFYSSDHKIQLGGLVVAEVKMGDHHQFSPFLHQMREQRIQSIGFSKYCMGVAMLYENVKKNTLKQKMLMVNKLMKGNNYYE